MPFHISPRNGAVRECNATERPCPYGSEFHADTKDAAITIRAGMIAAAKQPRGSINAVLRPTGASTSGFMGRFETYDEIVSQDMTYLHSQGVFPTEIEDALKKLVGIALMNRPEIKMARSPHVADDVTVDLIQSPYLGYQDCPWQGRKDGTACHGAHSGRAIRIVSPRGTVRTNELMLHTIGHHNFFQGHHSEYRVEPEKLLHVLGWH